jgi:hypothetical protein
MRRMSALNKQNESPSTALAVHIGNRAELVSDA